MSRKRLSVLLICLLLCGLPAADAQGSLVLPDRVNSLTSSVVHQGRLWMTTNDGEILTWHLEDGRMETLPYRLPSPETILLGTDGQLYALDLSAQQISRVLPGDASLETGEAIHIDLSAAPDIFLLSNAFILKGKLFLAFSQTFSPAPPSMLVVDIMTGAATPRHLDHLCYATPYREGRLLVTLRDHGLDERTQRPKPGRLASFDLESGALENMGDLGYPFSGEIYPVAYDAASDAVYIQGYQGVSRLEADGSLTLCAYSPYPNQCHMYAGQLPMLPDGQTILFRPGSLVRLSLDPHILPTGRLKLCGNLGGAGVERTMRRLPHMPVDVTPASFDDIRRLLVTGDSETDLFIIDSLDYDPELIMYKGYGTDLSGNQALASFVDGCYPFIRDYVRRDGRLIMLPVGIELPALHYEPNTFETFGLTVPDSFEALCALLDGWSPDDHPHLLPMISEDYPAFLTELALSLYADQCDAGGKEVNFQDEGLRQMLRLVERTDASAIPLQKGFDDAIRAMEEGGPRLLMKAPLPLTLDNLSGYFRFVNGRLPLFLSAAAGEAPLVPARLTLLFINPRSQHIRQAEEYLAQWLQSMRDEDRIMLQPAYSKLVENPEFSSIMRSYEGMLEFARQRARAAEEGPARRELEEAAERQEQQLEEIAQQYRYSVSEEGIQRYRDIADKAFIRRYCLQQPLRSEEVSRVFTRWLEGQLSLDQCLSEAENMLRLMRLEGR